MRPLVYHFQIVLLQSMVVDWSPLCSTIPLTPCTVISSIPLLISPTHGRSSFLSSFVLSTSAVKIRTFFYEYGSEKRFVLRGYLTFLDSSAFLKISEIISNPVTKVTGNKRISPVLAFFSFNSNNRDHIN